MKLVIEISERVVHHVKINYMDISENDYAMICDAVRTATPYEDRPQWIPCSERLPEEDGEYLIEWDAGWGAEIRIADYSQGGKYWYRDATGYEYRGVIAWMPLPKPYQKAGET